jgi:hypothetical protein
LALSDVMKTTDDARAQKIVDVAMQAAQAEAQKEMERRLTAFNKAIQKSEEVDARCQSPPPMGLAL